MTEFRYETRLRVEVVCKKLCLFVLAVLLMPVFAVQVSAGEEAEACIRQILNYYRYYQNRAEAEISDLLTRLEAVDPVQAEVWERLIGNWSWAYEEMAVNRDILPEGLPEDDSLCILVMGFGLNRDGSMKQELTDRLTVALRSAQAYPNAYILCTGGATSDFPGITEAGRMADWLAEQGIGESRIIRETESLSTTENVLNSYKILSADYPQVACVAVVTSDYHICRSCMMFNAVSIRASLLEGTRPIEVVGNAVCPAENRGGEDRYTQAWGLAILAGVDIAGMPEPQLYPTEGPTVPETTLPAPAAEPVQAPDPTAALLMCLLAFVMLVLPKWIER